MLPGGHLGRLGGHFVLLGGHFMLPGVHLVRLGGHLIRLGGHLFIIEENKWNIYVLLHKKTNITTHLRLIQIYATIDS